MRLQNEEIPGVIMKTQRLAAMKKAFSAGTAFDALHEVRELVPDNGMGAQQAVVYGFACILEANSAGLSILFDRFEDDELEKIRSSLEAIGAIRTLADFRQLQGVFASAVAGGRDRLDASEWMAVQPESQRIDRESEAHVREMEQKLLEFCKTHVDELAAG
jgi:hypothetical protein